MLNMAKPKQSRKQLFRVALVQAGMTAKQWAAKHEISEGHLWQVLSGPRESASLTEKVDEFIAIQVDQFIAQYLISKSARVA
jgi:hypothetical protein